LSEYKAVTKITIPGVPHDIAFSVDNKLLVLVESKKMDDMQHVHKSYGLRG